MPPALGLFSKQYGGLQGLLDSKADLTLEAQFFGKYAGHAVYPLGGRIGQPESRDLSLGLPDSVEVFRLYRDLCVDDMIPILKIGHLFIGGIEDISDRHGDLVVLLELFRAIDGFQLLHHTTCLDALSYLPHYQNYCSFHFQKAVL